MFVHQDKVFHGASALTCALAVTRMFDWGFNHYYPQLNVEEALLESASHYGLEEINIFALDLLSTISHEGAK